MSNGNPLIVTIFGTADGELPRLIADLGLRTVSLPMAELATFSAGSRPVDVAIVDLRTHHGLPKEVAGFKRRHATTAVVLVTATLEPTLILDAMRAGISECITDPLSAAAVEAAIARVAAQKVPDTCGQLFAFVGAKGGIGTTTLAVNVATALARTKEPTLFIDLHVAYGDAAVFLGAEPKFSVVDALENIHRLDHSLFKTLVVPTAPGLDLLASSSQGVVWSVDVQRVRRLLDFALQRYRYVIVDCPRSDATVLDSLEAASKIVLVANQDLAALRSGSRMAATLRQRYRADRVMVVVSRFDVKSEIGQGDVERVIGSAVRHRVPSDYRASIEALNRGRPLMLQNHTQLASSIEALAKELGGYTTTSARTGLLGRLAGKR